MSLKSNEIEENKFMLSIARSGTFSLDSLVHRSGKVAVWNISLIKIFIYHPVLICRLNVLDNFDPKCFIAIFDFFIQRGRFR